MAKSSSDSDNVWSLIAGMVIGAIIGIITAGVFFRHTAPLAPVHIAAVADASDTGPITSATTVDGPETPPAPTVEDFINLSMAQNQHEAEMDQIKAAAHNETIAARRMVADLRAAYTALENERDHYAAAAKQNEIAAVAARRQVAQEQEKAAWRNSESYKQEQRPVFTVPPPLYTTTYTDTASAPAQTAREKIAEFERRYPPLPPLINEIEIRDGRAYGPNGLLMNIDHRGGSSFISP